jgi:hypothetical protein
METPQFIAYYQVSTLPDLGVIDPPITTDEEREGETLATLNCTFANCFLIGYPTNCRRLDRALQT